LSATLPLADYGRIARDSPAIGGKRRWSVFPGKRDICIYHGAWERGFRQKMCALRFLREANASMKKG